MSVSDSVIANNEFLGMAADSISGTPISIMMVRNSTIANMAVMDWGQAERALPFPLRDQRLREMAPDGTIHRAAGPC